MCVPLSVSHIHVSVCECVCVCVCVCVWVCMGVWVEYCGFCSGKLLHVLCVQFQRIKLLETVWMTLLYYKIRWFDFYSSSTPLALESLGSERFFFFLVNAHQCCIYLIKNYSKQ